GMMLDPNYMPGYAPNSVGPTMDGAPIASPTAAGTETMPPNGVPAPSPVFQAPGSDETLPPPSTGAAIDPTSATSISPAELQFGVAGRNEEVRILVANGTLRRLPVVGVSDSRVGQ